MRTTRNYARAYPYVTIRDSAIFAAAYLRAAMRRTHFPSRRLSLFVAGAVLGTSVTVAVLATTLNVSDRAQVTLPCPADAAPAASGVAPRLRPAAPVLLGLSPLGASLSPPYGKRGTP